MRGEKNYEVEQWWNNGGTMVEPRTSCHMSHVMSHVMAPFLDTPGEEMETKTLHTKVKLGHMWINDDLDDIKCPAAQGTTSKLQVASGSLG